MSDLVGARIVSFAGRFLALAASAVFGFGCKPLEAATVPGPESDQLVRSTAGFVLTNPPSGGISAVRLPDLQETIVRAAGRANQVDMASVHSLAGPDAQGRIAYVEDHFFVANDRDRRHLLKTVQLDGTHDTELFTRPGDAMWSPNGEIGDHLALSPRGGRVVFVSELSKVQMPLALLFRGTAEIWDIEKKARISTASDVMDLGLSWFPDGKRLACVKLVEPRDLRVPGEQHNGFGKTFRGWSRAPVVMIRDVDAGSESQLHIGWHPVVSLDGKAVLMSNFEGAWMRVEVATGKAAAVTWPGVVWPGAVAAPTSDIVLSWCLPTAGQPARYTQNNSPLRGPKQMLSLKLARPGSNEFQTVIPYIDPRMAVSFGQLRAKDEPRP